MNGLNRSRVVPRDCVVIGAGWSGLLACKNLREEGLSVVVLEKRPDIGGVWFYSDDPETPTVMESTCTTSSSTLTEMSDFPMPDEIGEFPHHKDILSYLKSYCKTFDLYPYIRFNCGVEKADKLGDVWYVRCENGELFSSRYLVVCSGIHHTPNRELEGTLLKDFEGKIYHVGEIKKFVPEEEGRRIMVLGGGESASDIVEEWLDRVESIIWSIPRGQHFFRKYAKVLPHRKPQALDKACSRVLKFITPFVKGKPGEQVI